MAMAFLMMSTLAMFVETNPSFYMVLFLFLLLTSLTVQGLLLQRMQPWPTTCSQVAPGNGIFDGDIHSTFFQLWWSYAYFWWRFIFWWSFSMVEFFLHSSFGFAQWWWRFFLLLLLLCSPCPLWWSVVCGIVQFTQQCS